MSEKEQPARNRKGTWDQAILTFLFPILLVLTVRWCLFEPYVIPSGSMIPTLLIHDHILVKKFSYGLHVPFSSKWLLQWRGPSRGEIAVFRYPEDPEVFYIKRIVGLPGDAIEIRAGRITVNGRPFALSEQSESDLGFTYYKETNGETDYTVRFMTPSAETPLEVFKVPEGHYFAMGDNRDQSADSRAWGYLKSEYLIGEAAWIWLSCDKTLPTMSFVCDPAQIRWGRLFKSLQ